MPLDPVIARIPGLAGYEASRQSRMAEDAQNIESYGALQKILMQQQAMQEEAALKQLVSQSGGDVSKAIEAALRAGNVGAAAKLEGLAKLQQAERDRRETREGMTALKAPMPQQETGISPQSAAAVGAPWASQTQQPAAMTVSSCSPCGAE